MPRYKLTLEYDGTGLAGWQRQAREPSVQSHLEDAFRKLTGLDIFVQGAGRTDAGVHATGQTAHVDLPDGYREHEIRGAINFHLKPAPIAVLLAEAVGEDFHARFSATGRRYLFRILNRRAPPALERDHVWHVPVPLDADAMHAGAKFLVGHHDFTSFRATECQARSPMKTLDRLDVARVGEEIHIVAAARSFLHHQVRNMVGTLALVGSGKWQPERVGTALAQRDRSVAGPTSPPQGLYLTDVLYGSVENGGSDGDAARGDIDAGADDEIE
ncbi:MAG TPA: tRNA pseudouridine(38-40) synthase TruA [Stellaceae bacterium]|jgi:tRNA pseudouridine38-40 synthase|nr:tRNA pseudouridine(38-40) synthase TruA [Stellaceae bacterium]